MYLVFVQTPWTLESLLSHMLTGDWWLMDSQNGDWVLGNSTMRFKVWDFQSPSHHLPLRKAVGLKVDDAKDK